MPGKAERIATVLRAPTLRQPVVLAGAYAVTVWSTLAVITVLNSYPPAGGARRPKAGYLTSIRSRVGSSPGDVRVLNQAQQRIRRLLDSMVDSGGEQGVQVAAYLDGDLVLDTWAGSAGPSGTPVDGQTLFPVFSVSKGVTATAVHILVERGVFDYETRIAQFWPRFAAHGKDVVTLAHVLEHSAGVPYFPAGLGPDDLLDRERISGLIADSVPAWEPGTRTGYHSLTFGYLVDQLIRGATGRTLEEVVREEITVPLGIDQDMFIVPPEQHAHRLADIDGSAFTAVQAQLPDGHPLARVVGGFTLDALVPRTSVPDGRSWSLAAPLPFGTTMTARAGARLYGALANDGEIDGVRLLSPQRLALATRIRRRDVDQIVGAPIPKSLGYTHGDPVTGFAESAFGFGGLGGAKAYADPAHRISFAFTHNRLTPPTENDNALPVAAELRTALGFC